MRRPGLLVPGLRLRPAHSREPTPSVAPTTSGCWPRGEHAREQPTVTRPGPPLPARLSTPVPPLPHYGGRAPVPAPYVEEAPRYAAEPGAPYEAPHDARYDERRWDGDYDDQDHDDQDHDGYAYDEQYEDHGDHDEPYQQPRTNTMAVLGLVFAFVFSPLGLVFSAIGLRQVERRWERGRGLAIAGLVVSILMLAMGTLVWLLVLPKIQEAAEEMAVQPVAEELSEATGTELSRVGGAN